MKNTDEKERLKKKGWTFKQGKHVITATHTTGIKEWANTYTELFKKIRGY